MTEDDHLTGLGKVVGNLHALEHALRIFLCEANGETLEYPASSGITVPETRLTDRQSPRPIIDEYNNNLKPAEQQYRVDPNVVEIRDALAHGRIISTAPMFPVTLYKFGIKDGAGRIFVERVDVLNESWFANSRDLLRKQIVSVVECSQGRSYGSIVGHTPPGM
jgi:hypothetical protein